MGDDVARVVTHLEIMVSALESWCTPAQIKSKQT